MAVGKNNFHPVARTAGIIHVADNSRLGPDIVGKSTGGHFAIHGKTVTIQMVGIVGSIVHQVRIELEAGD